jgi:hypothetical protein
MLTRWLLSCTMLALPLGACGHKSEADRVAEHERVRVSWEQTSRMTGAEWARGALPDAYAERTLERAGEELQQERESLAKEALPDSIRARLGSSLEHTRGLADSVERAVRARDRSAVNAIVERSPRPRADSLLREAGLR